MELLFARNKTLRRNSLFFNQFQHCLEFVVPGAGALRKLDHRDIDTWVRWQHYLDTTRHKFLPVRASKSPSAHEISNLHEICDILCNLPVPKKITISQNTVRVYTNSKQCFQVLMDHDCIENKFCTITTCDVKAEQGVMALKNPTHSHRTYLKSLRLDIKNMESIKAFLQAQDDITMSKSLRNWIHRNYSSVESHFFYDHNGPAVNYMLGLINPNVVRKTFLLVADK